MARVGHLENLLSGNNITSWYFLVNSAKSVEVPIELSEDCYCNLSVPINRGEEPAIGEFLRGILP